MQSSSDAPTSSSLISNPVVIAVCAGVCMFCAFRGKTALSVFFGFITLLTLSSFLWGRASLKKLNYNLSEPPGGIFPGQTVSITRKIHNGKLLPLMWLELMEPCDPNGCVVPEEKFIVSNRNAKEDDPPENRHQTLYTFSLLGWHQTLTFSDEWRAKRRGIHCVNTVTLRSGDGFGLCARSTEIKLPSPRILAVYPELVDVSVDRILQDMWDSRSAAYGYLEDITLLRSVRDYRPSDPAKRINQRLLARGMGLNVNQYEVVAPSDVLFILDCASFDGEPPEDFETALSILASLLAGLSGRNIRAGIITPESKYFPETCIQPDAGETELIRKLTLLAAAETGSPPLREQYMYAPELVGQTYYIAHSAGSATSLRVLAPFPEHKVKLLAFRTEQNADERQLQVRPIHRFRRAS